MSLPFSSFLFREVRPDFFRVLSGPLARLYVDSLDALEQETSRRNYVIERDEAVALVEQIVEQHREIAEVPDEPLAQAKTTRDKARAVLEALKLAGWLMEEDSRSDYRRLIFFEATGVVLLQTLRKIAFPDAAVFSDKLVTVCTTLANKTALANEPWAQVDSCVDLLQVGLAELRAMENSIKRLTKQQLAAATLKENLWVLFDQFAERIGRTCYAELVHARLPSRLADAKRAIDDPEGLGGEKLQNRMELELMRREPDLPSETASARVRLRLAKLYELLEQVEPLANDIDRRTAEFARRSQSRFRYLQETTSENRARIQKFFENLNRNFAGNRLGEIEEFELEVPALLLHDTRLIGGMESLYSPHLRREAGEIEPMEDADASQQDHALAQLEGTMRNSLTVSRANRFVSMLPGGRGVQIDSAAILNRIHTEDDIADLIACLLHAKSTDAQFDVKVPRHQTDADASEFLEKLNYRIERFTIIKK